MFTVGTCCSKRAPRSVLSVLVGLPSCRVGAAMSRSDGGGRGLCGTGSELPPSGRYSRQEVDSEEAEERTSVVRH